MSLRNALALSLCLAFASACSPQGMDDFEAVVRAGEGLGDRVRLEDLKGRVVVLDFWAHWCPPCRESAPVLNALHKEFQGQEVSFYGVNVEGNLSPRKLIAEHKDFGFEFPSLHDASETLKSGYFVSSLPTLVVVGRDGKVHGRHIGAAHEEKVRKLIEEALGRP